MRVTLVYRALSGLTEDGEDRYSNGSFSTRQLPPKPKPSIKLLIDPSDKEVNNIAEGFTIHLKSNIAESNGLGLESEVVAGWIKKEQATRSAKKQATRGKWKQCFW